MNTNNEYSINVKSPKFNPVICDILYGTEIMGDTPRLAFVFSVNPKAKINNPTKYINKRFVLLFKIIFLSLKN